MASLTDKRIKNTYDGLLKTTDNDPLGGSYKLITDGLGNSSNVYLGTGGAVGIGRSAPRGKFDVYGDFYVTTPNGIDYLEITDTNVKIGDGEDANGFAFLHLDSQVFKFITDSVEVMRITSDGKVGIGTDSPGSLLHLESASPKIQFTDTTTNASSYIDADSGFGSISIMADHGNNVANSQINLLVDGTSKMVIKNTGNVGIGTTSPVIGLQVESSTSEVNRSLRLAYDSSYFFDLRQKGAGGVSYNAQNSTSGGHRFEIDGSEKVRIAYNGNVGIGTTSPQAKLQIEDGNLYFKNDSYGDDNRIGFGNPARNGDAAFIDYIGNGDFRGSLVFGVVTTASNTAATEIVRFDKSGNVGIGTTSPTSNLHVRGDNPVININDSNSTSRYACLAFSTAGGSWRISSGDSTTGTSSNLFITRAGDGTSNRFVFDRDLYRFGVYDNTNTLKTVIRANGNSYFNGGNVGIGTTSPVSPLTVKSNSASSGNSGLRIEANGSTDAIALIGEKSGNKARLHMYNAGVEKIAFYTDGTNNHISAGNLGIGTTSPYTNFEVVGKGSFGVAGSSNLGVEISSVSAIPAAQVKGYIASATSGAGGGNGDLLIASRTSASTNIRFFAGSTSERMRIDSSGNVGIGTTSPSTKLQVEDVNAGGVFDALLLTNKSTTAGTSTKIKFVNSTDAASTFNTNYINSVRNAGSDNDLIFGTSNSDRMTIDSSGNVGIGTTSPSTKLEVAGVTTISASTTNALYVNNSANSSAAIRSTNTYLSINANNYIILGSTTLNYRGIWALNNKPYRFQETDGTWVDILNLSGTDNVLKFGTITDVSTGGDIAFYTDNSEKMRIDSSGNVGIGTTSPSQKLHVKGDDATLLLQDSTTGFSSQASGIILTSTDGSGNPRTDVQYKLKVNSNTFEITYGASDSQRLKIDSDGGLFVPSLLGSSDSNPDVRYNTTTGELYYNSSSIRYKEDVTDIESTIDKINKLRPVKFKVKESQKYTTGLIAEEVVDVLPELVFKRQIEGFEEPQIDGVVYNDLHAYYIKAIQEQQEMINELKTEIQTLKSQINS